MRRTCVRSRSQTIRRYRHSVIGFTRPKGKTCGACGGDGLKLDNRQPCRRCNGTGRTIS